MRDDVLAGVFDSVMPGPIATAAFIEHKPSESLMPRIPEMSHRTFMPGGYAIPFVTATTSMPYCISPVSSPVRFR